MYKIILIDDNKTFLEGFYELIEWDRFDFEVVGRFNDGSDALEYIENNRVDAVISDIRMPELSGIELARIIRESYPDIKVVFFSAYCDFQTAAEAIKCDVVGYISKPIKTTQIEEALERLREKLAERTKDDIRELVDWQVIVEREELFCHWLDSDTMHSDFLKDDLAKVNIMYQAVHMQCALAVFRIEGIDEKFASRWRDDKKNFYEAMTKAVCVDTYSYYTVRLSLTDESFYILYIAKRDKALSRRVVTVASDDLREIFGLKLQKTDFIIFESMTEFKETIGKTKNPELKNLVKAIGKRKDGNLLIQVENYVNEHYMDAIDIESVANQCHYHPKRFSQVFKAMKGEKFIDYLNKVRIQKAQELLLKGCDIEEVYAMVGYDSKRYFYRLFSEYTGATPAKYRKKMLEARQ